MKLNDAARELIGVSRAMEFFAKHVPIPACIMSIDLSGRFRLRTVESSPRRGRVFIAASVSHASA